MQDLEEAIAAFNRDPEQGVAIITGARVRRHSARAAILK
jgi:enoyl-CoA hydratase/carnithine racemase